MPCRLLRTLGAAGTGSGPTEDAVEIVLMAIGHHPPGLSGSGRRSAGMSMHQAAPGQLSREALTTWGSRLRPDLMVSSVGWLLTSPLPRAAHLYGDTECLRAVAMTLVK